VERSFKLRALYQMKFNPKVPRNFSVAYRSSVELVTVGSVLQVPIVLSDFLLGHNPNSVFLINLRFCCILSMVVQESFFRPKALSK